MESKDLIIPHWLRTRSDLTPTQKLIMAEVLALSGEDGCWASNAHFTKLHGVSARTVGTAIKELQDLELISVGARDGWRILTPQRKNFDSPAKKLRTPAKKLRGGAKKLRTSIIYHEDNNAQYNAKDDNKIDLITRNITRREDNTFETQNSAYDKTTKFLISGKAVNAYDVIAFFKAQGAQQGDADDFINYYESVGWTVNRTPVVNWKALAMRWIKKSAPQPKINFV